MGKSELLQKQTANPPAVNQLEETTQMKSATAPAFSVQAAPIQRQGGGASPVTRSQSDIDAMKNKLDNDPSIIKPGETWNKANREDGAIADAALARSGIKRKRELKTYEMFGRNVNNINKFCKPKVDKANELYNAILDPKVKKDITESLQVMGGFNHRVMNKASSMDKDLKSYGLTGYKKLTISDHAFGCAIDVNANKGTQQNHHFEKTEKRVPGQPRDRANVDPVLFFMEKVIKKYNPSFDLVTSKGLDQFDGINSFPQHLNTYVNSILGHVEAMDIFSDEKEVKRKLKASKTEKKDCNFILAHWDIFKGYSRGTKTWEEKVKRNGEWTKVTKHSINQEGEAVDRKNPDDLQLQGVVDFHREFLRIMLAAGWSWGGNFGASNKDYMHFEDDTAMELMMTPE